MINQTSRSEAMQVQPETVAADVLAPSVDAALEHAKQRIELRAELEGFCRRPVDVATIAFLIENGRLAHEEAYELHERVESLFMQMHEAAEIMGLLTAEEADALEAQFPPSFEERFISALRINKDDGEEWLGLAERMRDEQGNSVPAWIETAAESFPTIFPDIEHAAEEAAEQSGLPAVPFIGGWWAAEPTPAPPLESRFQMFREDSSHDPEEGVAFPDGWWSWEPLEAAPEEAS